MDTSKTYIKMCEKAEEIQALKRIGSLIHRTKTGDILSLDLEDGDFFTKPLDFTLYAVFVAPREVEIDMGYSELNRVWLPRQDQLQEMVDFKPFYSINSKENAKYDLNIFMRFCEWGYGSSIFVKQPKELFPSMEQLWLAFVMKERYKKVWDGEEWQTDQR